jgi:hypothetical protein
MSQTTYVKGPTEVLIYGFDWSGWLDSGDSINTSNWEVEAGSGLTSSSPTISGYTTLIKVSGGTVSASGGMPYKLANTIVTANGLTAVRSLYMWVQTR